MISAAPLYVLYHVADDIHYMSYVAEKQENEKNDTTFSFFDDVNRHLNQQTEILNEIADTQAQLIQALTTGTQEETNSEE